MALLDGKEIYVCEKTKTEKAMRGFINVKFEVSFQLHALLLPSLPFWFLFFHWVQFFTAHVLLRHKFYVSRG